MTTKDLSQLYYIKRDIKHLQEQIKYLEARTTKITASTDTPSVQGGIKDKSQTIVNLITLKDELKEKQLELDETYTKLMRFIENIPDTQTRLIFRLRYINNLSWRAVAFKVGGKNTEESMKKRVYRYLENSK